MNLYLRLIWTLLRAWWLPRIAIDDTLTREFRVLPNDIDINIHMNNGRYLTVADLMTIEYFARTGFLRVLTRKKWRPMLGGAIISYRKQLGLGEKYRLSYRWVGSGVYFNYLHFEFRNMKGQLCAAGYAKGAAVSSKGLVHTDRAFEAMNIAPDMPLLPAAVEAWRKSEAALMEGVDLVT